MIATSPICSIPIRYMPFGEEKNEPISKKGKTMAATTQNAYFIVKNQKGEEYLCPLNAVKDARAVTNDELDDCVEKEVAEIHGVRLGAAKRRLH